MSSKRERTKDLAEAASWHLRVAEEDFSRADYERWLEWISSDPEHGTAFDDIVKLSNHLRDGTEAFSNIPIPDRNELWTDTYDPDTSVSDWRESQRQNETGAGTTRFRWMAIAASALIVSTTAVFVLGELPDLGSSETVHSYATSVSQHENIELPDGSRIEIGGESTVTVSYNSEGRTAVLESGEAFFVVERDHGRPFRVLAGRGTITAIGTEFNVRRESDRVLVTVSEGMVTVSPRGAGSGQVFDDVDSATATTLTVGQQIAYDAAGMTDIEIVDPSIATSWKQRRLQYLREPLRFVIAGVNRYSNIEIVVADSDLEDLTFTGTVYDGQTDEWLQGLSEVLPIEVDYVGNSTVLLKRRN